jgi:Ca2+-binding RTX toxin-like protein
MVLGVLLLSGVTLAVTKACTTNPCVGTDANDRLRGDERANQIYGLGGTDHIPGKAGTDELNGGRGNDTLDGGVADDRVDGDYGSDRESGGPGNTLSSPQTVTRKPSTAALAPTTRPTSITRT